MTAVPIGVPRFFVRDPDDDTPLDGGKVYFYIPGTTTEKAIYTDSAKSAEHANPVILKADGGENIYIEGEYDVVIKRPDDTLVKAIDNVTSDPSASGSGLGSGEVEYSANHTIDSTESGLKIIGNNPSGFTFSFDPAADLGTDFWCIVVNEGTGPIVLDPDGAETINEVSTITLYAGESAIVWSNGTKLRAIATLYLLVSGDLGLDATEQAQARGNVGFGLGTAIDDDDIDGSNILTLPTDGDTFVFTGTQQLDAIASLAVGAEIELQFGSARQLTHHATDLILPGGANITTASGDVGKFREYAAGDWRCVNYMRAGSVPHNGIWEHVQTQTPSGAASADFTDLGAYSMLRITGDLIPGTDAQNLWLRTDNANGASFDDTAAAYTHLVLGFTEADDTKVVISPSSVGNDTGERISFEILVTGFNKAQYTLMNARVSMTNSAGDAKVAMTMGRRNSASAQNAFQLLFASGTINGEITLEGKRG